MTEIWGHRGAMGYYPENTMVSFKKAVEMGVHGIELDVHLSKDNYLIVCHDERVDRTTNGNGWIKEMTYKELRSLDAGIGFDDKFKGQKLPLLEEVLEYLNTKNVKLNIELKAGSSFYKNIELKVLNLIDEYNIKNNTIISSFDHKALVKIKEYDKKVKTGILYVAALYKPLNYLHTVRADALHPYYLTIDKELINNSIQNNVPINTYTVNDTDIIKKLINYNVNAIITNYPDKALKILNAHV